MAVDVNSEDGQILRKLIPLNTLPTAQFTELCSKAVVEKLHDDFLFRKGEADDRLVYLLTGEVSLQSDGLVVESVIADSDAAKFALAHQIPRKIDAIAKGTVRILRLDASFIKNARVQPVEAEDKGYMIIEESEADPDDWMTALLRSPIFQRLPPANLQKILMGLETVDFEKGQVIVEQGSAGDYYYLIKSGHCLLTRKPSPNAKEIKLAELGNGDTFGEDALLSEAPRNVTVTAIAKTVLFRLNKDQFITLIKDPSLKFISYIEMQDLVSRGAILLDVRSQDEYEVWHLDGSINAPFFTLRMQLKTLSREKPVIVVCANGKQSEAAAFLLLRNRVKALILRGGMESVAPELMVTHQASVMRAKTEAARFKIDDGIETLIDLPESLPQDNNSSLLEKTPSVLRQAESYEDKVVNLTSENQALNHRNAQLKALCLKLKEEKESHEKQLLSLQQQIVKLTQMVSILKGTKDGG